MQKSGCLRFSLIAKAKENKDKNKTDIFNPRESAGSCVFFIYAKTEPKLFVKCLSGRIGFVGFGLYLKAKMQIFFR